MKAHQAIDLSQLFQSIRLLKDQAEKQDLPLLLTNQATRAFSANLIGSVREFPEDHPMVLLAELHFPGLYGGMGALPDYFTDAIISHRTQENGLRDFLDLFNHRFLETLYDIWRRQQVFLDNLLRVDDPDSLKYDRFVRALGGLPDDRDKADDVRCLSRYHMALLQCKPKTKLGLLHLLSTFFPTQDFDLDEHIMQILDIPEHQRARLDPQQPPVLGSLGSFLIGSRIQDINGKVRLNISQLDFATYMAFLPGGKHHNQLKTLVETYTEDQWQVALRLELRADEVPKMQLNGQCRLGANSWLLSQPAEENAQIEFRSLAA